MVITQWLFSFSRMEGWAIELVIDRYADDRCAEQQRWNISCRGLAPMDNQQALLRK